MEMAFMPVEKLNNWKSGTVGKKCNQLIQTFMILPESGGIHCANWWCIRQCPCAISTDGLTYSHWQFEHSVGISPAQTKHGKPLANCGARQTGFGRTIVQHGEDALALNFRQS
jgi:hypothetical protein